MGVVGTEGFPPVNKKRAIFGRHCAVRGETGSETSSLCYCSSDSLNCSLKQFCLWLVRGSMPCPLGFWHRDGRPPGAPQTYHHCIVINTVLMQELWKIVMYITCIGIMHARKYEHGIVNLEKVNIMRIKQCPTYCCRNCSDDNYYYPSSVYFLRGLNCVFAICRCSTPPNPPPLIEARIPLCKLLVESYIC